MTNINKYLYIAIACFFSLSMSSCLDDLNSSPIDENIKTEFDAQSVYTKIYASLALGGNEQADGSGDLDGIDGGASGFLRLLWNLNELPGDDVICAWSGDKPIFELNYQLFTSQNDFVRSFYYRLYFQLAMCNHYLSKTEGNDALTASRAEIRFMRALSYYYIVDLYGGGPFVDENSGIGSYHPPYINRVDLYNYVEAELLACLPDLKDARTNEYGKADKAAAWMLLSRLYLNAQVYTGKENYAEAAKYAKQVIDAGYSLEPEYKHLFYADNNTSNEFIFTINFDGVRSKTYGGTTFLLNSCMRGDMQTLQLFGTLGAWGGNRARKALVTKFDDDASDKRAMFVIQPAEPDSKPRTLEIDEVSDFTQGYSIAKFSNLRKDGQPANDPAQQFADTDFPLFRLAEALLTYAEATVKSGGNVAGAVSAINQLRTRAQARQISASELLNPDLFFSIERSKELYLEGQRRTDLIRFGLFDEGVWDWKGGVKEGVKTPSYRKLYPIPASDITSNPNLIDKQNPGY